MRRWCASTARSKALAITTDCTPRYCYADPYEGGKQAVAEAYRNICAVGARRWRSPTASTSPTRSGPRSWPRSSAASKAWARPAARSTIPIVSGNVSLYNESKATGGGSAILPTPAIGGVGLIDDYDHDGHHAPSRPKTAARKAARRRST
jgi:phosphoribosylformylglycinamidine synthase subunit PurL